jgi:hypothetical protein
LTPPLVTYDLWCPDPRLGWNAPSLRALMKRPASDLLDDQLIAKLKRKQSAISQKTTSKRVKVKQLKSLVDEAIEINFF